MKDQLSSQYSETELNQQAMHIYTTLDPDLQRAAAEAVDEGMKLVDEQVEKRREHKSKVGKAKNAKIEITVQNGPMPQVGAASRLILTPAKCWRWSADATTDEPVESCGGQAADGLDFQALRVCRSGQHSGERRPR